MKEYRWYGPPPLDLPRENPAPADLPRLLDALTNELSDIVQDPEIAVKIEKLGSRPGHCAAASEAMKIIAQHDSRFGNIQLKAQRLEPRSANKDIHFRLYSEDLNAFYDPTLYQFDGCAVEDLYSPSETTKVKFVGFQSLRSSAPFTVRKSTLELLNEFYRRFPSDKAIRVLSDTRMGPRLMLLADASVSSADQALFDAAFNLIGQEVEVHTNRTKKIWSIKDPYNNDKLIGYARNSVVLEDVKWTQPTLGVARRTFHNTPSAAATSARTGERSVQAFAQGKLVAFDGLPIPKKVQRAMASCQTLHLTYRPTIDAPEWVGAFRDRSTRAGVDVSKYAKLDWVNTEDGQRVADAKAYCDVVYLDPALLEEFRQSIIRENGAGREDFTLFVRSDLSRDKLEMFDAFARTLAEQTRTHVPAELYAYMGILNAEKVLVGVLFVSGLDAACFSFETVVAPEYRALRLSNLLGEFATYVFDQYKQQHKGDLTYCVETDDRKLKTALENQGFVIVAVAHQQTTTIWMLTR